LIKIKMTEENNQSDTRIIIEIDPEFLEVLNLLEDKIKKVTWEGMDKVSKKVLTKILAKKVIASKLL